MGATSRDIFGSDPNAVDALPGTYGEAPSGYRLPADTRLGGVVLQVADLARSLAYYQNVLGLRVIDSNDQVATLGAHGTSAHGTSEGLVELRERKGAKPVVGRGRLGLYHFAILLPDQPSLGRFVKHLADLGVRAGASDHLVSEAFYLHDPDGLGIEVYYDRPRSTWKRQGAQLMMASDPINMRALVAAAGEAAWSGMPEGTKMGHVHLHVGNIDRASAFFSDAVGFDRIVWNYPGALFLSAGGYHHHLGTNTWAGEGAPSAADDDARLVEWTIELPSASDVDAVAASVEAKGFPVSRDSASSAALLTDPWGTQVRVRAAQTAAA